MVVVCGLNTNLLVEALCCLVQDQDQLVKRGALDLLLSQFDFSIISFSPQEKIAIVSASISVVLARDMSLNRRLFSIIRNCADEVEIVLKAMFQEESNDPLVLQKPYKIMLSLMDHQVYGDLIMNRVLLIMLESLFTKHNSSNPQCSLKSDVLLPVATSLISSIHPYLFWKNIFFWLQSLQNDDQINAIDWEKVRYSFNTYF
jgi:hypothetical protein